MNNIIASRQLNIIESLISYVDLYKKGDFYIGQTNNPPYRLKTHYNDKKFIFMIVLYCDSKENIDYLEHNLINYYCKYETCLNIQTYNETKQIDNNNPNYYLYLASPVIVTIDDFYLKFPNEIKDLKFHNPPFKYSNQLLFIDTFINNDTKIKVCIKNNNNEKIKITKQENNIKKKPEDITVDKINKLISQNKHNFKFMHIGKCDNYQKIKQKYICSGIKANKIKQIYKCNQCDIIENLYKYLKKYYQNNNNISLKKSSLFSSLILMLKTKKNCNNIYIYFYN